MLLPLEAWQAARTGGTARTPPDAGAWPVPPMLKAVVVAWLASFAWSALAAPAVSPEALLLGVAGPLWCLLIALAAIPFISLTAAHIAGTVAVACIALAQAVALAVTLSRAGAHGLACSGVVFAAFLRHPRSRWVMAGAVLAAAMAIVASGGRGTAETLRGRVYIWQNAWAHTWEQPITGISPGAFELNDAGWDETARASRRTGACDARCAGPHKTIDASRVRA